MAYEQTAVPRLEQEAIEHMFEALLTEPEVFQEARQHLLPEHFDPDTETILSVLWVVMLEQMQKHGEFRYKPLRLALLEAVAEDDGLEITREAAAFLLAESDASTTGLLDYIFNKRLDTEKVTADHGMDVLRRFLEERAVVDKLQEITSARYGSGVASNYTELLEAITVEQSRIRSMGQSSAQIPVPDSWAPTPLRGVKSLIAPFDNFMPHGQPYGGVCGLLAPMGVGKTTAATHLAVSTAKYFQFLHDEMGEPLRVSVIVTYEEPVDRLRNRVIACGAQVSKTTLDRASGWDDFATTGSKLEYEKGIEFLPEYAVPDGDGQILGERERIHVSATWLNRNLVLLDMSGMGRGGLRKSTGDGYIPELKAELARLQRTMKLPIGQVVVDYVGKMIDRHMRAEDIELGHLRHWIRACPDQLRMEIAEPFDCTVWALHQMSGEATKKNATAKLHHSDAAEGRMFAENMHYCFVIGNKDEGTRVSLLHCSKDRDTGNENKRVLIEVNGMMQRIEDREGQFAVDDYGDRIREKSDLNRMGGAPTVAMAAAASRNGVQAGAARRSNRPPPPESGDPYTGTDAEYAGSSEIDDGTDG